MIHTVSHRTTLDAVLFDEFGSSDALEETYALNPGLAGQGPVLLPGTVINLPEVVAETITPTVRLWS